LAFNGLHGVISQKIEPFTTTAVSTSDPMFRGSEVKLHALATIISGETNEMQMLRDVWKVGHTRLSISRISKKISILTKFTVTAGVRKVNTIFLGAPS
jgi:hypothetical protein